MTHRYRIEAAAGLLIDKFQGKMGWQDVLEGIMESSGDPEFRPGMNVLADLTAVDLDFGYDGVRALTFEISRSPNMKFGQIAVVAPGSLQFGLARMFGVLAVLILVFLTIPVHALAFAVSFLTVAIGGMIWEVSKLLKHNQDGS